MDSLPAEQTVTLTRSGQQPDCQSYVDNVNMTTSSDSMLFVGLEENSVYSVRVIVITYNLTRSVSAAYNITPTAGEYTGSYFVQGGFLIIIYIYRERERAPSVAPHDFTSVNS